MMKSLFKIILKASFILFLTLGLTGCKNKNTATNNKLVEDIKEIGAFQEDYNFLKKYSKDIILLQSGKSMVVVSPVLQGRVMTSSADGMQGASYGWINKSHYESGELNPQINIYGGEERFWLGPEGGQYSIFFKDGEDFTFDNWETPKLIDLEPFDVIEKSFDKATFTKTASLTNYSGFTFNFSINRTVSIVSKEETLETLGIESIDGIKAVGYKTENELKNIGAEAWTKDKGLLSIWLLGMLKHSETTTIVIPYVDGDETELGTIVNDDYFGKVPSDRLVVTDKAIFFKGDGKERGKIGLTPQRSKNVLGSYDSENNTLTLVKFNKPEGVTDYVNSKWELQKHPYAGDVVNSYNDGPAKPGAKPLGPFYELETSSPAAALQPNEAITHIQFTFHFEGDKSILNKIAVATLGVSLDEIIKVF